MHTDTFITIAIDGAAACGKSSTARMLAKELRLLHVDTGAHYRTLALELLAADIEPEMHLAIETCVSSIQLTTEISDQNAFLKVNGRVPNGHVLRTPKINTVVSLFAANPMIRKCLLTYQRSLVDLAKAKGYRGIVMEGRDIGSVVLPEANFSFYLEADPAVRERRRSQEHSGDNLAHRDHLDSKRTHAPLQKLDHAIHIDTTHHSLDAIVASMRTHMQLT